MQQTQIVKRVLSIDAEDSSNQELLEEYKEVFLGLACRPGIHKIKLKNNAQPVAHACTKVPFKVRDQLKKELDGMESQQVIEKIDEPKDWVSPLVIVEKKNSKLKICLDPRDLNKQIQRENVSCHLVRAIMAEFANAKSFSKLDASSDFGTCDLTRAAVISAHL